MKRLKKSARSRTSSITSKAASSRRKTAPARASSVVHDFQVVVANDHAAVTAKHIVIDALAELGVRYVDLGVAVDRSVDYPDYAAQVARAVASGRAQRGILLCGTGIGMSIAANKVPGVRAALVHDVTTARMSRLHNDANVLTLGGGLLGERLIREIVAVWLETDFEGGRHSRRLAKIASIEAGPAAAGRVGKVQPKKAKRRATR